MGVHRTLASNDWMEIGSRAHSVLKRASLAPIDTLSVSDRQMLRLEGCGRTTLGEIRSAVERLLIGIRYS